MHENLKIVTEQIDIIYERQRQALWQLRSNPKIKPMQIYEKLRQLIMEEEPPCTK